MVASRRSNRVSRLLELSFSLPSSSTKCLYSLCLYTFNLIYLYKSSIYYYYYYYYSYSYLFYYFYYYYYWSICLLMLFLGRLRHWLLALLENIEERLRPREELANLSRLRFYCSYVFNWFSLFIYICSLNLNYSLNYITY